VGQVLPENVNRFFDTRYLNVHFEFHYTVFKFGNSELFVSQGLGLFRFNPLDSDKSPLLSQSFTRAEDEGYGLISFMFPSQMGFHMRLVNGFGIGVQAGFYNPLTNYIDNIGELGQGRNFDNLLFFRMMFFVPIKLPSPGDK
jgi:hypothetical protein